MLPRPQENRLWGELFCRQVYKPPVSPLRELYHIAIQQEELEVRRLGDFDRLFSEPDR